MEREYRVGAHILYCDPHGKKRDALVTVWWMPDDVPSYAGPNGEPGCNLVVVADDERREDQYGRQIDHETSVVHKNHQPAYGNYWCWPDEV